MLTVKQASEQLGVSASLIYGLCAGGKLRHERFGLGRGTIRIPLDAIEEFRRRHTVIAGGAETAPRVKLTQPLRHLKL
jgi:excisionase family DNA binding protein